MKLNWAKFWTTVFVILGALAVIIAFSMGIEWVYNNIGPGWAYTATAIFVGIPFVATIAAINARED